MGSRGCEEVIRQQDSRSGSKSHKEPRNISRKKRHSSRSEALSITIAWEAAGRVALDSQGVIKRMQELGRTQPRS